ncbi:MULTISPECIES: DUF624 domain-containing protein [Microbacterium]|uniref:DUF624 domain-containing protein n=1 Tax=Microbacterium TaxID=33882 RepID=UPI000903A21F|nr:MULTISPECIES: DUF624 domain-containing protein [Microbacterium]APF34123.1 ferredoxin-NADPH reductase [Microbacterium paludicola]POX67841.1 DUF624 domain-containing protein [Microbacterium sp. Ru50]
MKRISHNTYATVFGVVYLGLMTNLLLLASCLPLVVLLVITDPALSWPMLAVVAPLCAPGITAAFATFRAHGEGENQVVRTFIRSWKRSWRKALALGTVVVAALVVVLVDVRFFAPLQAGVAVVPVLGVLTVLLLAAGLVAFAALAEEPDASLRSIARAAVFLSVRRWWLSLVSLAVLALQAGLFVAMPAIAIGLTSAPALYLAWANARYILRPVLGDPEPQTV